MPIVPTLKERIGNLLGDTATADVTFVVGEERERIPAHALVMSTASDSFRAMFFGDFNGERVVEIPDATPDGFRALMKCVYTDEVDITEDNVESLIQLADKYLLTGLLDECTEWLKQNLTAANVCRFLPIGELYSAVGKACWQLMLRHGNDALKSEAFLCLPKDLIARALASDQLVADEITVYRRAIDWAKRQRERNNHPDGPDAIRATLGDVLYLIRFPLFAVEEFANGPAESGVLSAEECVSIFQWLTMNKKPALFSVDARASGLLDIDELLKQFDAPRRGTCEHERGVKVDLEQLLKLRETARTSCQHGSPWICLTCNQTFCDKSNTCGLFHHSQETRHGLLFYTGNNKDIVYCGMCEEHIAYK